MMSGANDRIRLGLIGVNGRGRGIASGLAKMSECEITWVCDVDSRALDSCVSLIRDLTGKSPKRATDLRRVIEASDVDGVVIATPDHWHVPAGVMAMRAGRHVYLEKPMSHIPAENAILIREEAASGVVVQGGNQRRSWPNVIAGIEEVKAGNIGKVCFAKGWYTNGRKSIGTGKVTPIPDWLDWNLWQGPAPREDFRDNIIHYNWHWFRNWGGGEFLNNGMHFLDLLRWGLGVDYPTHVDSVGDRYYYEDDYEFPDTQLVAYQFGARAAFSMECRTCNAGPVEGLYAGVGFYGEKGNLFIHGGNVYKIRDHKGKIVKEIKSNLKFESSDLMNPSEALDAYHFRNWFDAIRMGTPLNSPLKEACISTQLAQYGVIAQSVGHCLDIDPFTGEVIDPDRDVRRLWSKDYEKGWEPDKW